MAVLPNSASAARRSARLGVALAGSILVAQLAATPTYAGGGSGGNSPEFDGIPGGPGGAGGGDGADGQNGGDGPNVSTNYGGGGGGGGGAGGGLGGTGGSQPSGAAGGTAGLDGGSSTALGNGGGGGGGGNGGANGQSSIGGLIVNLSINGGAGGGGGSGGDTTGLASEGGGGGGGGAGGYGLIVTGATANTNNATLKSGNGGGGGRGGDATGGISPSGSDGGFGGSGGDGSAGVNLSASGAALINNGTVQGGDGGTGGRGGNASGGNSVVPSVGGTGGNGGAGAIGVLFTGGSGTLTNTGTIQGGNGGGAGAAGVGVSGGAVDGTAGSAGPGGTGVVGAGLTIINSGSISGGFANGGSGPQANAITFFGGTNILELQAGSTITGNVVAFSAGDTFRLGGTVSAIFDVSQIGASTQYRGFGSFQKTGSGTWTLVGTNTGGVPWTINAGTLAVDGSITNSTMTVNAGGTLGGTGVTGAATVNVGGSFAPGNGTPGSSMTVASLALVSGAVYSVQINPATSSFANVTGAAMLNGATVNAVFASGTYISKQYTILTAGSVPSTFAPTVVNTNLPTNFIDTLSYDATHAFLNLKLDFAVPGGLNGNQQAVGNALTGIFQRQRQHSACVRRTDGGGSHAGLRRDCCWICQQTTFDAMTMFMGVLTDPFIGGRGDGLPPAGGTAATGYASTQKTGAARDANAMFTKAPPVTTFDQRWSVWAAGFGGSQSTSGSTATGSNDATSRIFGGAAGADYRFSPNTIAGFALAGGGTNFSVANGGTGRSDLFQAGAFIRHNVGAAYITAAAAYGWQDITTDRTVTVAGIDRLHAEFNANAWSGRLEGGYRYRHARSWAALASRLMRRSRPPSLICLPMPSRRWSAAAILR